MNLPNFSFSELVSSFFYDNVWKNFSRYNYMFLINLCGPFPKEICGVFNNESEYPIPFYANDAITVLEWICTFPVF